MQSDLISKSPPYSKDAERSVLCSMIIDERYLIEALDVLSVDMFYATAHQIVFGAIIDVYRDGEGVDLVEIGNTIGSERLREIGGSSFLADLLNAVATGANIKSHCKIVKDKSRLRDILMWSHGVQSEAIKNRDPEDILTDAERSILDLSSSGKSGRSPETMNIFSEMAEEHRKIESGEMKLYALDQKLFKGMVPHYHPGHVMALAAYTSNGKSSFMAQMVVHACRQGASVIAFSLEDKRGGKMSKLIANISNVPQRTQLVGRFTPNEWDAVSRAKDEISGWNLLTYDDVRTLSEMRIKIKQKMLRGGVNIVFLDYVQKIRGEGSIYERMSSASLDMFEIAIDLDLTFVFLSQIDNQSAREGGRVIGLKGAGELVADPDVVMLLERVNQDSPGCERDLDLTIRKNRAFGPTGLCRTQFSEKFTRIEPRGLQS